MKTGEILKAQLDWSQFETWRCDLKQNNDRCLVPSPMWEVCSCLWNFRDWRPAVTEAAWALQGTITLPVHKLHFSLSSNNNRKDSHVDIEVGYALLSIILQIHIENVYSWDVAEIVVSVCCFPDFKKKKNNKKLVPLLQRLIKKTFMHTNCDGFHTHGEGCNCQWLQLNAVRVSPDWSWGSDTSRMPCSSGQLQQQKRPACFCSHDASVSPIRRQDNQISVFDYCNDTIMGLL